MKKISLKKLFALGAGLGIILGLFIISVALVHAQPSTGALTEVGQTTGLSTQSLPVTIAKIVRVIISLLGIITFGIIFYAGFLWMTARGNEDQVARAKAIMRNGVVGLLIVLVSFSLTQYILSRLLGAVNNTPAHCFNNTKDEDETNIDCGGSCGACTVGGGGGGGGLPGSDVLYISSLPASGDACIRNVHPTIIFNRDVDIATVNDAITIQKKNGGVAASGTWKYGEQKNIITFAAEGNCGSGESDCLEGATDYILTIAHPEELKSLTDNLLLDCTVQAGCGPVNFKTGADIDRLPPTISIVSPSPNSTVSAGAVVPVKVQFSDDNGVQSLVLFQNTNLITSQSLSSCKKTGTVDLNWPTSLLNPGTYTLRGEAIDWAAHSGVTTTQVKIAPQHCFNDALEPDLGEIEKGPPACGAECGSCGGDVCRANADCASGYCELQGARGTCVDKMRIESVSPSSGAPGTFVTISGYYFGDKPGEVYFTQGANPNIVSKTNVVKASLAGCGPTTKAWTPNQIIVEVPVGAITGPIFVITNAVTGRDGTSRMFTDATNDSWGSHVPDFEVTAQIHPGLCSVTPENGVSGDTVQLVGKNFGLLDSANDQVTFGNLKAEVGAANWSNETIKTNVPLLIDQGVVGIKVVNNGIESNGVRFVVNQGQSEDTPVISSITPNVGSSGEYITITGKNFGNTLGAVWFKSTPDSEAIVADTSFPEGCATSIWRDDQIIVKFPKNRGDNGTSYYLQVKTANNKITHLDQTFKFTLQPGDPSPGICSLSPVSAPLPFPEGNVMQIRGEYFGTDSEVYFWKSGAQAKTIDGRIPVTHNNLNSSSDTLLTLRPPTTLTTGPVIVYRPKDKKMSNPASFTVLDCVKNNNSCTTAGTVCCASGRDTGICKAVNELCSGAPASSGYVSRFSTADIPAIPHVVERCNDDTNVGKNIPTPAPSIQWDVRDTDEHHNVCRTALVTAEFTQALNQATVNNSTVLVNKCSSNKDINDCENPVPITLTADSYTLKAAVGQTGGILRHYLSLSPSTGRWDDATWYQVVFKKGISSQDKKQSLFLSADRPCSVTDSAYCFVFKTDAHDCRIKTLVITPYSYWTSVLESPVKYRSDSGTEELRYYGTGLSDQRCIMMDTSNFDWQWKSDNTTYSDIVGERTAQSAQVSALANTVGVGLTNPDNAVSISAVASRGAASYTGKSPLTIDLNNPEVVNFWPQCLEACTNAEVGVQFSTTMSNRNLPGSAVGGTVQLLKCLDENCTGTVPVLRTTDVYLDPATHFSVLKLANSQLTSGTLEPNTLYQVILSASSTSPLNVSNILWSSARFGNPLSYSKPYNKVFTWRFKTKNTACVLDHVTVDPSEYLANSITDRTTFTAASFSSPDTCSKEGQKLNPWLINWQWQSRDTKVAAVDTFTTKGSNQYCTNACIKKGSDIPAGGEVSAICGNGKIEAGEDCDGPDKNKGCSLDCRLMGSTAPTCGDGKVEPDLGEACDPKDPKTSQGCTVDCRHAGSNSEVNTQDVTASICGNGSIGAGEDCDKGISASTSDKNSSLNCSSTCVHTGTRISAQWCFANRLTQGGFSNEEYNRVCTTALSQCGNKVQEPDEDTGCDDPILGWNQAECNQFCLKKDPKQCSPLSEGCDSTGHYQGSSILYTKPSVCGDGKVGLGEDAFCEQNLTSLRTDPLVDPWSLVRGIGQGTPSGNPPTQKSIITASAKEPSKGTTIAGEGSFAIKCGFNTDQDCQQIYGKEYGVGANSCCYAHPKLLSTYPVDNSVNTCPNTYLEAVFDSQIDARSLPGNVIIARGNSSCAAGQEDVTALITALDSPEQTVQLAWYQQLFRWFKQLWGSPVQAAPPHWCAGADLGSAQVIPSDSSTSTSHIQIKLDTPLALTSEYVVILKDGVKTTQGVTIGKNKDKYISWHFSTAAQICQLDSLKVEPAQWSFSRAGATTTLQAKPATASGALIQGIPGAYDWEYMWGPVANPFVSVAPSTSSLNTITAQNRNGEQEIRAAARLTANKFTSATGTIATGNSRVIVFLCENPWPPKDLYIADKGPFMIFPFEDKQGNNDGFDIASNTFNNTPIPPSGAVTDGYFNFSTYYCADKGSPGTIDDFPYLRGAVQVSNTIVSPTSSLKRFIFTNTQNSDAIGVQVFPNPNHLTAEEWYSNAKNAGGQGFAGSLQHVQIGKYDAVTDGNNIYVDALNYSSITHNIYSNIYLFSINDTASADTKAVFEQFLKNLSFNSNLTNYGYCGSTLDNPDFATSCQNDLDCPQGQVCSAQISKLQRNYQRLRDLKKLQDTLQAYFTANKHYPELSEGTFLKGQNISTWPSWETFSSVLGATLPVDPINKLGKAGTCSTDFNHFCTNDTMCPGGKCVLHDAQTGWSTTDRRFSFACATSSYAYRYILASSTDFAVKTHFENAGISITNFDLFAQQFIDTNRFIIRDANGICNQDQEISTINQGKCGDGIVNANLGEECDPVGSVRYGTCSGGIIGVPHSSTIKVDVCSNACKWTPSSTPYIDCGALSKCGNGKIETGETCDEGVLNGRYNHCTKSCTLPPAESCGDGIVQKAYEVCDIADKLTGKAGVCVNGVHPGFACNTDADCRDIGGFAGGNSFAGTCRLISDTKVRYAKNQKDSCNFDCQSSGPYCGDGVVESQFGEECDGSQSCTVAGTTGSRVCSADCKWSDASASAWWRLDDAYVDRLTHTTRFSEAASSTLSLSCGTNCPTFAPQARGDKNAFKFDGSDFIATASGSQVSSVSGLTLEAWVNPSVYHDWMRILEKGGYLRDGGYTLQFNGGGLSNHTVGMVVWNSGSKIATGLTSVQEVPLNQWTHVAVTYQRQGNAHTFKMYINGKLDNIFTTTTAQQLLAPVTDQLVIGRAVSGNSFFEGMLSDVKVFGYGLSDAEIANHYNEQWVCSIPRGVVAGLPTGSNVCGDGKIDEGEACDRGAQNGTPCTPGYGRSCSYCSADCKNVIDVNSKEFCGNGVVDGAETCDTDSVNNKVYSFLMSSSTKTDRSEDHKGYEVLSCEAEAQDPYSYKQGNKICANACSSIQSKCTVCGLDDLKGVPITGALISAVNPQLAPLAPLQNVVMELMGGAKVVGHTGWHGDVTPEYALKTPAEDTYTASTLAKESSDPSCSVGANRYQIRLNGDESRRIDFPVSAVSSTGQYNLILSPVISSQTRPHDVRIVISSIGKIDFFGGLLIPKRGVSSSLVEGPALVPLSIGAQYYNVSPPLSGIWYHGAGTVKGTNVESFTLDVSQMFDTQYGFYVRLPQAHITDPGIWSYRDTTHLKVDIYLPENETRVDVFSRPAQTFYITSASPSANPSASIWHVFDLRKPVVGPEGDLGPINLIPVNEIVSDFKSF